MMLSVPTSLTSGRWQHKKQQYKNKKHTQAQKNNLKKTIKSE